MLSDTGKLGLLIFLLALTGCTAAAGGDRSLVVSPSTVAFGQQQVDTVNQLPVTITNSGHGAVQIQNISLDSSGGFALNGSPQAITLPPGRSMQVNVSFKPMVPTSYTGTMQVISNATSAKVVLTGAGTSSAISVSISPTNASVQVGHSQQFSAAVSNTSNTAVSWLVNGTVGGDSNVGTISSTGLYTAPSSVPSPSSVSVTAQSVADASKSASASVSIASGSGAQYYVTPTGSDSNDGSAGSPWATIAHAATVIGPGATVHVAPGTYTGYITTSAIGTASARITYISDVQWGAKIVGDLVDRSTWHNYGDYVDIVGFELTSVGRMGLYNDGSFVRYIGNHVHDVAGPTSAMCDAGGAGIMHGNYSASDDDMIGNFVHDIGLVNSAQCSGFVTVHGLYHANLRGRIVDNLVIHARDYGIHLYHSATNVIVVNNTSLKNGSSGLVVGNSGGGSDNFTIVTNNIFAYNQNYGFRDDSGTSGPNNKYYNNLTFSNGDGNYVASGGTVSGNISSDPQFVNYTGTALGDYHLKAGSPAIDSGTTLNAPSIDLDGGVRPVGSGYDIGCYEYGTTPGTWPWY